MPLTRIALIVSAVFLVSLFGFSIWQGQKGDKAPEIQRGQALVGGPFTLVNQNGETVTEHSFGKKLLVIYFGFTYCPDICPTELATLTQALDVLSADELAQIQPLFMTVDPARDTPKALQAYLSNFHPAFMGLTGSQQQVDAALQGWRVYWAKVDDPSSSAGYTFDHSALTYVMDKDNQYLAHITFGATQEEIVEKIRAYLN